jgi:hypothetical protein
MNSAKITLQKIAGVLLTACGAWRLAGLTLVHNYSNTEHYLRDMTIFAYISLVLGLGMLFVGLMLFADPRSPQTKVINAKTGITVAAIAIIGVGLIFQIIDAARILGRDTNDSTAMVYALFYSVVPGFLLLLTAGIISIVALALKHSDISASGEDAQKEQEKRKQQLQIQYLQMRVRELLDARDADKKKDEGQYE